MAHSGTHPLRLSLMAEMYRPTAASLTWIISRASGEPRVVSMVCCQGEKIMDMTSLCAREVVSIDANASPPDAARLMSDEHVGGLKSPARALRNGTQREQSERSSFYVPVRRRL